MDREQIRSAVLAVIEAIAPDTDVGDLRPDQPLRRQIDLDSMDWLNVIAALHERLAVDVPESDHGRLKTLDSIVDYFASRPAGTARATAVTQLPHARYLINDIPVEVRPIRRDDMPLEADFVHHLSPESRYQRFMATVNELPERKLHYLTDVDQVRHVALAATTMRDGAPVLVGVVRYVVGPSGTDCEFAIAIDDAWQRSGLAGILMHALIGIARARGLRTMEGFVLTTNTRMLKFTRQLGFRQQRDYEDRDTVRVALPLQAP